MTAEEYIEAYTRGCSNETFDGQYEPWMTIDDVREAVRLAREETRQRILKVRDAIDGDIRLPLDFSRFETEGELVLNAPIHKTFGLKYGEKVKVIILRSDDSKGKATESIAQD